MVEGEMRAIENLCGQPFLFRHPSPAPDRWVFGDRIPQPGNSRRITYLIQGLNIH
jgi:hypothetical protein